MTKASQWCKLSTAKRPRTRFNEDMIDHGVQKDSWRLSNKYSKIILFSPTSYTREVCFDTITLLYRGAIGRAWNRYGLLTILTTTPSILVRNLSTCFAPQHSSMFWVKLIRLICKYRYRQSQQSLTAQYVAMVGIRAQTSIDNVLFSLS